MRGGRREGAGRPKGVSDGSTKQRAERVQAAMRAAEARLSDPFEGDAHQLLIEVYKDKTHPLQVRVDAAKAAIGYEKPRLQSVTGSMDVKHSSQEDALDVMERLKQRGTAASVGHH